MSEGLASINARAVALEGAACGLNTVEIARVISDATGEMVSEAQVCALLMTGAEAANAPPPPAVRKPSRIIIAEVALKHGVRASDITGPSRHRHIMHARCEAIRKVAAEWPNLSYPILGRIFGNRDHTTIMNHFDKSGHGRQTCSCDRHGSAGASSNTNEGSSANG